MEKYMDIEMRAIAGASAPVVATQIVRGLHHYLAHNDAQIALGLPGARTGAKRRVGNVVRLFCESTDNLNGVADALEQSRLLRDYIAIKRIKTVPESVEQWVAYTRYRYPVKWKTKKRSEQAHLLDELPVIFARSAKNAEQRFSLIVKPLHRSTKPDDTVHGRLNGYGLSNSSAPVWLPVIE